MDLNYVSAHARVFESVRSARFRALDDFRLGPAAQGETCHYETENPGHLYCDRTAVALWVQAPSGTTTPLCKRHLDVWMEDCYGHLKHDPDPPVVVPLYRRTV